MTADDRVWFKIARKTGCSVTRAMNETTVTQFEQWKTLFEEENAGQSDDLLLWHLAQIAREAALIPVRVWGKSPRIETKEFMMKLVDSAAGERELTEEEKKAHMEHSMATWRGVGAAVRSTAEVAPPQSVTMTSGG